MKTIRKWFGKVGFTAIGVGVGVILAAGSGFAAVQLSRNSASDHSIDAVQATSSNVGSVDKEKSTVSGVDDRVGPDDRSGTSGPGSVAGDTGASRQLDGRYACTYRPHAAFRHCRGTNGLYRGWR